MSCLTTGADFHVTMGITFRRKDLMSARLITDLPFPSWEDHLEVGLARAGLTRRAEPKPSRRRRAGLALVGDVQDIAGVLDVLDRQR
jgi:hypothetical protein